MSMTKGEFWTAAGVVVAAAGVVVAALVGGGFIGYDLGQDSAEAKLAANEEKIRNLEKINNGINVSVLLDTLAERSSDLGDKLLLTKEVDEFREKTNALEEQIKDKNKQLTTEKSISEKLRKEITSLESLINKNFSTLSEIDVYRNKSSWLIPGQVAIGVSSFLPNAAYTTISGLNTTWMDIGERVDFVYETDKCFVILTSATKPHAKFSFACKPGE